jgi:hypothetical protein
VGHFRAAPRLAAIAVALATLAASASAAPDPWKALYRPLHIPRIEAGAPCPVANTDPKGDLSRLGRFGGAAWGLGPAYPGGLGDVRPVLGFRWPASESGFAPSGWSGNKVLWIVAPYRGPGILVRGRQIDGPNELRFNGGIVPARALRLIRQGGNPSYARVRAPGCYAFQLDGAAFSRVVVFEARPYPQS